MTLETYQNAADFLLKAQAVLEKNEAANNLMLGIGLRLRNFPEKIKAARYLATVTDEHELVVAAVMTPPHKLVVYCEKTEHGEAMELLARDLLADRWGLPGVLGPSRVAEAFAITWAKVSGASYRQGMRQRVYELRKVIPPQARCGALRLAAEDDIELVASWIFAFTDEALTGGDMAEARETAMSKISERDLYIWEDGQPVAMAAKSRPTTNGIAVNLVYTPPELRRRGYASACVAALSQLLLDAGWKFCCLFTDLSNPTSNHIYQQIGYTPVGDFNEYIFDGTTQY
ncbi:MAG: GNAT family N-acetyltransferase [bacterium]